MKERIWLEPCPGVGFRAVILRRLLGFRKVLYRDLWGRCGIEWVPAYYSGLIPGREPPHQGKES